MPTELLGSQFIELHLGGALQIVLLGFIGGVLSGFIGSGGAFFMTPGMMNLGVRGPVAVASNIAHKFGKAIIGSRKHGELGHVDKKLAIFMLLTAAAGIRLAVLCMALTARAGESDAGGGAGANLYISAVFVGVLSLVSCSMLWDVHRSSKSDEKQPSRRVVELLERFRLRPLVRFPVADVRVSLWIVMICGLATGYLAGTIGVGGFIGVPAMIYVFGVPAQVAAGSELYLAIFMGAFGLLNYGFAGLVDVRLVLLLYLGSLVGIHIGAYGTKVVKESVIRLATGVIIALCVISRATAIPVYLRQLGMLVYDPRYDASFDTVSQVLLYLSGVGTTGLILAFVFRGYVQRRQVRASIVLARDASPMVKGRLARKES